MRRILTPFPFELFIFILTMAGILFVSPQVVPFAGWAILAGLAFLALGCLRYSQNKSISQVESGILMSAAFCLVAGLVILIDHRQFWVAIIAGLAAVVVVGMVFRDYEGGEGNK